ncbi:MAG: hypothetical protein HFG35_06665 [Eubacterium sp.]|nr:hypothetical protein [Eubacterium sp.]
MSINGIGAAGYPSVGYVARNTERSVESGTSGFMEIAAAGARSIRSLRSILKNGWKTGCSKTESVI